MPPPTGSWPRSGAGSAYIARPSRLGKIEFEVRAPIGRRLVSTAIADKYRSSHQSRHAQRDARAGWPGESRSC